MPPPCQGPTSGCLASPPEGAGTVATSREGQLGVRGTCPQGRLRGVHLPDGAAPAPPSPGITAGTPFWSLSLRKSRAEGCWGAGGQGCRAPWGGGRPPPSPLPPWGAV